MDASELPRTLTPHHNKKRKNSPPSRLVIDLLSFVKLDRDCSVTLSLAQRRQPHHRSKYTLANFLPSQPSRCMRRSRRERRHGRARSPFRHRRTYTPHVVDSVVREIVVKPIMAGLRYLYSVRLSPNTLPKDAIGSGGGANFERISSPAGNAMVHVEYGIVFPGD